MSFSNQSKFLSSCAANMYGIKKYTRLSRKQFAIRTLSTDLELTYVPLGFFKTINILNPFPIAILATISTVSWALFLQRTFIYQKYELLLLHGIYTQITLLAFTAGMHRLWSHRAFRASTPLKIALAITSAMIGQFSAKSWSIGHRLHHKFSDCDKDPHNTMR